MIKKNGTNDRKSQPPPPPPPPIRAGSFSARVMCSSDVMLEGNNGSEQLQSNATKNVTQTVLKLY